MWDVLAVIVVVGLLVYGLKRAGVGGPKLEEIVGEGKEFLRQNKEKEGVIELASGLQYQILEKGDGSYFPSENDHVLVHYHGTLLNGTVFDSSVDLGEPLSFGLQQVIQGWTEGLQKMQVGDKARLWIPANLGYGMRRVGNIPAGSLLIFDVELLEVHS